jgi:hypothetical protein
MRSARYNVTADSSSSRRIADYAHMMQLRKSRWMGTQIIQIGA